MAAKMPKQPMVVANKYLDGTTHYGTRGETHAELISRMGRSEDDIAQLGFARYQNEFLSREEALKISGQQADPGWMGQPIPGRQSTIER